MDEQMRQLFGEGAATGTCLAEGCFGREHYIPQHLRMQIGKRPFPHCKGQYVGRMINAAIAGVQPAHPGIVNDEHTQITALTFEGREQPQQRLSEHLGVDWDDLLLVPATDGHSCFAYGA